MIKNHNIITLKINIMMSSGSAMMFENLKGQKVWVPKSLCEYDNDGELQIPEWLALDKGLI